MGRLANKSILITGGNSGIGLAAAQEFDREPIATIEGHAKRGDFSRWIGEVFGDQLLAVAIGQVEEQYRIGHVADLAKELPRPIRERYELGH